MCGNRGGGVDIVFVGVGGSAGAGRVVDTVFVVTVEMLLMLLLLVLVVVVVIVLSGGCVGGYVEMAHVVVEL